MSAPGWEEVNRPGSTAKEATADADLVEGWYLMSTGDLEQELARRRSPERPIEPSGAIRLSVQEALAYRNAGNFPDERGRTLRLVLLARDPDEVRNLSDKRSLYEPDYLDPPIWRKPGSKPVNVFPLLGAMEGAEPGPWWEQPELAELESECISSGTIDGLRIPEDYRGFVYKTILELRSARREVTVDHIADSIARWLGPGETAEIRSALERENQAQG